ncbi:unnamed protein product [Parnassius apollo]|uniref:(apollo) hypothetical protein n=1 Tax=Parnassius apollo TaxID=110799 RepID=A0A8S3W860_PARAO|nr:unnamed protein product [Parnassius apollo]
MEIFSSKNFEEIQVDMEDFDFTQEDLRALTLLDTSIIQQNEQDNQSHLELSDSNEEQLHIPKKRRRLIIQSDSESESDSVRNYVTANITASDRVSKKWSRPRRQQPSIIPFTETSSMNKEFSTILKEADPGAFYSLLVSDEIFDMIVEQTNLFALQSCESRNVKPSSRSHAWKPTDRHKIKRFFGLILYMGLVRLPKLSYYWSKDKILGQTFPRTVMSRNRFEIILQYLHLVIMKPQINLIESLR